MKVLPILLIGVVFTIVYCTSCNERREGILETITTEEAAELIEDNADNPDFHIIDVRTKAEYEEVRLENSVNIDYYSSSFSQDIDKLEKNDTFLVYCRSGNRSGMAMTIFRNLDFQEVYNMDGGITKWIGEDRPVVEGSK